MGNGNGENFLSGKVPEEKQVNIRTYYLSSEADI